jgi:imidazoleglycerol-phosphate dehydratase
MNNRLSSFHRKTGETDVTIQLNLDGQGKSKIVTGNGMLDHLISQIARHGLFDIEIDAQGDLHTGWHHTVEDVAIAFGRALREALGESEGITRMGHALVPLDEALARVAIDISGRGFALIETNFITDKVEDLPGDLVRHFLETLAVESKITLHVTVLSGINDHHIAEAIFKALAKALSEAVRLDPRRNSEIPSTKGTLQ